jgi:hypothetical protein
MILNVNDLQKKLAGDWGRKKSSPDISYIDPGFKQRPIGAALLELNNLNLSPGRDPFWRLGDAGGGSKNYLPIEGHAAAIFCNKILFFKAGIKLPNDRLLNADEFLEIVRIRGRVGVLDWSNVPQQGKGNNTSVILTERATGSIGTAVALDWRNSFCNLQSSNPVYPGGTLPELILYLPISIKYLSLR